MKLKLTRPIIFFDIEATGLKISSDRIVELCFIKVYPNSNEESQVIRFNPGIHISAEASAVNGIHDEDVADCPYFKDKAAELAAIFQDADLAGFNSNKFDVPMLVEEFARAGADFDISKCKLVDVQNIYHKMEQRNLSAAYKFYCNQDLTNAHTALADTKATYEVLQAQLDKYGDNLKNDIKWLSEFSRQNNNIDLAGRFVYNEQGTPVFNFGKYKGQSVSDVLHRDSGYFGWMMQGDFTQDTKQTLMRLRLNNGLI